MQKVYVLCTGGTIEKVYVEHSGSVENIDSKIDGYLQRLRLPDLSVQTLRLMNKDSLEMTDADRNQVLRAVQKRLKKPSDEEGPISPNDALNSSTKAKGCSAGLFGPTDDLMFDVEHDAFGP